MSFLTAYYRGPVTYSTNVTLDSSKRYYLYIQPAYQRADVVLNGSTVATLETYGATDTEGQHVFTVERPGIPVVIDLTAVPFANGGNTLTIKTDNTSTFFNIPYNGVLDIYNMLGGVTLCAAGKLCFDPVAYGTRRCHLTPSTSSVTVEVAVTSNSNQSGTDSGSIVADLYLEGSTTSIYNAVVPVTVDPGTTETYTFTLQASTNAATNKWRLGSGRRFKVVLKLSSDTSNGYQDTIEEYFGFRSFSAAKHNSLDDGYGFTLNGSTTSLYGVTYHHWDRIPTTTEMDADWAIISALKPKMIRFAYFPALHYLLDKCDEAGIVAMLEIPWMYDFHNINWNPNDLEGYRYGFRLRYQHNVTANAVAMANEFYNHPSVMFYSLGTGFGIKNYHEYYETQAHDYITEELLPAIRAADSSRIVCFEFTGNTAAAWTDTFDVLMERMNSGWGSGSISGVLDEADAWNGKNATIPVGFMDWSYGANPSDHVEWSSASTKPSNTGNNNAVPYPEEYQAYCVEQYATNALALKWPVFNLYGAVFDFAASAVSAGGKSGVMQTGLVTRDRSIIKDAYYYLKAMWNSEPMVHITQKRNMNKESSPITLRIYTNCEYVKVYSSAMVLLATLQRTSGYYVVTQSVTLEEGNNTFYVTGHSTSDGEATCSDSVTVSYEDTSSTTRIVIYSDSAIVNSGKVNSVVLPGTEPQGVTWSSDTPSIATVDSGGTVTVLLDGTATIRATSTNDNSITKTKVIPCYVRGATDSLYYQAVTQLEDPNNVTYRGITITRNSDGTTTLNGTLVSGSTGFRLYPCAQNGTSIAFTNRALFPVWNIPGDQLLTAKIVGGTITGTPTGDPFTLTPVNEEYTALPQAELKPLNEVNGNGDVNAKLIPGCTLGFGSFWLNTTYPAGTVFNNVVLRVQSYKQAASYYNAGILEGHLEPVNTLIMHDKDALYNSAIDKCNMYSRNADGSHSELVANPNNGTSIPPYGRITDGFAIGRHASDIISGSTIAVAGDVVKFTVVMKNWPQGYVAKNKGEEDAEWSFVALYADGTTAAQLYWAHGYDDTGVDFTGGTASTTFVAEKTVDCVAWHRYFFAWPQSLDCTHTVTWQAKMELVDPSEVPPTSITVYSSNRIVNSGLLNAVCLPVGTNPNVTWSSSNTSVATVDSSGKVTVVADGQCTFTATSVLDNTKAGSVTVTCHKVTTTNLFGNAAVAFQSGSTTSIRGVTVTNNGDGSFTLNGTVTDRNATFYRLCPVATNTPMGFFPVAGISGDVIVWMEYVSGTVTGTNSLSGHDFEVCPLDPSGNELTSCRLNFVQLPTSNGDSQSVLITGNTDGVRYLNLRSHRALNTVFDNYTFKVGLEKFSSLGNIYAGGLLESYLPSLCSCEKITNTSIYFERMPDGSMFFDLPLPAASTSTNWNNNKAFIRLTGGLKAGTSRSDIKGSDTIAAANATYKFKVKFVDPLTWDSSVGSNGELSFSVMGTDSNNTQLATLSYIKNHAVTNTFDSNGEAEITFTPTSGIRCVYLYGNGFRPTSDLRIQLKLEEVTT